MRSYNFSELYRFYDNVNVNEWIFPEKTVANSCLYFASDDRSNIEL